MSDPYRNQGQYYNNPASSSGDGRRSQVPQRGPSSVGYSPQVSDRISSNDRTGYPRQDYGQRSSSSAYPSNDAYQNRSSSAHQQYGQHQLGGQPGNKWADAAASIQEDYNAPPVRTWETVDDEPENYDDSGWLERKTKKTQMDSLNTSQRALEKVNHAQMVAQNNLEKLALQSGKC